MLLAVEFKDELGCVAVKIDNVSIDRNLAWIPGSEPGDRAMKTRSAQPSPMSSARAGCLRKARANWRRSGGAAFGPLTPDPSPDGRGGDCASIERQSQLRANPSENGIEIAADLRVGESEDTNPEVFDDGRPPGVVVRKPFMLSAVQLDYQLGCMTIEVRDVSIERNLSSELGAFESRS